jgi:threonine dehydrogenase-like Zn-dependent dehydrogenase
MKAVSCSKGVLSTVDLPEPKPGKGQVLVAVLRCGVCGSDLHARHHCDHWADLMVRAGYKGFMRSNEKVIFGHEICGEVLEYGAGCKRKLKPGARICALPVLRNSVDGEIDMVGFSSKVAGGYAERMLVEENLMLQVPDGLDTDLAALTEPMAVAWHAVQRGDVGPGDVALVVGCGPVGLAVICMLKAQGVERIVASDFSPGRRELALKCGADMVVDPKQESPYEAVAEGEEFLGGVTDAFELAFDTREKLGKLPIDWWHTWRLAERVGMGVSGPVIFECVGMPGLLQQIIEGAPILSRVVVVGVCMSVDKIEPAMGINKEVEVRFTLGYTPLEFRDTLHKIADGKVPCEPLITGKVGLDGVENAFDALSDPEVHAKILIDPCSSVSDLG